MLVRIVFMLGGVVMLATQVSASDVVDLAASFIGRPYSWGAEGPRAFDCSGLTHYVFSEFGVALPRRAVDQSRTGAPAGRRLRRGDLLFFASDSRRSLVTHVGIYEGRGTMINASQRHARVRRDDLSEEFWADRFMFARRITTGDDQDEREPTVPEREPRRRANEDEVKREAARMLGRLAEALLRRVPRR